MNNYQIIYDDAARLYGDVNTSCDDRLLTDNTCLMQQAGMSVHCQAGVPLPITKVSLIGYAYDSALYGRLLTELETRTGKAARRW